MNRRNLIKSLAGIPAAVLAPSLAQGEIVKVAPSGVDFTTELIQYRIYPEVHNPKTLTRLVCDKIAWLHARKGQKSIWVEFDRVSPEKMMEWTDEINKKEDSGYSVWFERLRDDRGTYSNRFNIVIDKKFFSSHGYGPVFESDVMKGLYGV